MHSHTIGDFAHDHNFLGDQHDAHANRTRWVVALTAAMMIVEIIAGLWTGSMAFLADGIHMATHAGAPGIAAFAYSYAPRHSPNARFPSGTGRWGYAPGFLCALLQSGQCALWDKWWE